MKFLAHRLGEAICAWYNNRFAVIIPQCLFSVSYTHLGYNVEHLKNELAAILKLDQSHTAIIIGAGNLGRALINNFNFGKSGFAVLAAFDANPAMSDTKVGSTPVLHVSRLDEFLSRTTPDIAVLTLPKTEAQAMAKRLIEHGVRGLWNFTSADLHIDNPDAVVENCLLYTSPGGDIA